MNKSLKRFFVFISPVFIFLIHFLFVFAKTKPFSQPVAKIAGLNPVLKIAGNSGEECPVTTKVSAYDSLKLSTMGLSKQAFECAMKGFNALRSVGKLNNDSIISIEHCTEVKEENTETGEANNCHLF